MPKTLAIITSFSPSSFCLLPDIRYIRYKIRCRTSFCLLPDIRYIRYIRYIPYIARCRTSFFMTSVTSATSRTLLVAELPSS